MHPNFRASTISSTHYAPNPTADAAAAQAPSARDLKDLLAVIIGVCEIPRRQP